MSDTLYLPIAAGADATMLSRLGGKATGLLKLTRMRGVRVPEGVILSAELLDRVLRAWGQSGSADVAQDPARSVISLPLPWFAQAVIRRAVASVWPGELPPLIVRSSASSEDQVRNSAAGCFRSVFPITDHTGVIAAVRQVWASLFRSPGENRPAMAVIVQRLVPAVASGVVFAGTAGVRIEAISGLAGPLVNGEVRPDLWEFDVRGRLLRKSIVARSSQRRLTEQLRVQDEEIAPRDRFRPALSDGVARTLARKAMRIARREGEVDLEFCLGPCGRLSFVQLRPQTRPIPDHELDPLVSALEVDAGCPRLALGGVTASWGAAVGRLVLVDAVAGEQEIGRGAREHLRGGDILVTSTVNIGATPFLPLLAGIVAERGGSLSHTAILAREFGIPAIVGATSARARIRDFMDGQWKLLAPGVWAAEDVSLDASTATLLVGRHRVEPKRLLTVLSELTPQAQSQVPRASEWAHFVEADGDEDPGWTGKPEYPLCPLQLDLFTRAWHEAFDFLGIPAGEQGPTWSVITPFPHPQQRLDGSWLIGTIRPGRTEIASPAEYLAVAFRTPELCHMGDRLLDGSEEWRSTLEIPPRVWRIHLERKKVFRRLAGLQREMMQTPDVLALDLRKIFRVYTRAIAFAHLRATFRRRVVLSLREAASRRVPAPLRTQCEALLTRWSEGLASETTHVRDVAFRALLFDVASGEFSATEVQERLREYGEWFKFDRSDRDTLDTQPPLERIRQALEEELARGSLEAISGREYRTARGYTSDVETLRRLIQQEDPSFPFRAFKRCLVLAREIPAMTDLERHLQHRFQQTLRKVLLELQDRLRAARLLSEETIFNYSVDRLLLLLEELRHHDSVASFG